MKMRHIQDAQVVEYKQQYQGTHAMPKSKIYEEKVDASYITQDSQNMDDIFSHIISV